MNIIVVLDTCEELIAQAKTELSHDNDFRAEQNLVKLRELLNSQPELEAGDSHGR